MNLEQANQLEESLGYLEHYQSKGIVGHREHLKEILSPMIEKTRERQFKIDRRIKYSWADFNPQTVCSQIQNNLSSVETFYSEATDLYRHCDKELQDLLHLLELSELTSEEMLKTAERIKEVRLERRKAKDMELLLKPMLRYVKRNEKAIKELGLLSESLLMTEKELDKRQYRPRTLDTLQPTEPKE